MQLVGGGKIHSLRHPTSSRPDLRPCHLLTDRYAVLPRLPHAGRWHFPKDMERLKDADTSAASFSYVLLCPMLRKIWRCVGLLWGPSVGCCDTPIPNKESHIGLVSFAPSVYFFIFLFFIYFFWGGEGGRGSEGRFCIKSEVLHSVMSTRPPLTIEG